MRDHDVGKVRVDGFYNLIVIVSEFLKLEVKVAEPGDELRLRRVTSDDDELLGEDSFDNKTAAVMLRSGLTKQLVETDILLFIEAERIFITRCSRLPVGYVCQFSVGIHIWLKKRVATRERPRPRRASVFVGQTEVCRTKTQLATL